MKRRRQVRKTQVTVAAVTTARAPDAWPCTLLDRASEEPGRHCALRMCDVEVLDCQRYPRQHLWASCTTGPITSLPSATLGTNGMTQLRSLKPPVPFLPPALEVPKRDHPAHQFDINVPPRSLWSSRYLPRASISVPFEVSQPRHVLAPSFSNDKLQARSTCACHPRAPQYLCLVL